MTTLPLLRNTFLAVFAVAAVAMAGCTTHDRLQYSYEKPFKNFPARAQAPTVIIPPSGASSTVITEPSLPVK